MLRDYELALSDWIMKMLPDNSLVIWGEDAEAYQYMSKSKVFPFAIFKRVDDNQTLTKSIDIEEGAVSTKYFINEFEYIVRLYVEKSVDTVKLQANTRYFIEDNSYIQVIYDNELIPIGARILYIDLKEDRSSNDPKGQLRYVELKFKSWIPIVRSTTAFDGLIEGISININGANAKFVKSSKGWSKITPSVL